MIDERDVFEKSFRRYEPEDGSFERLVQRRDRKRRNQRIAAGVVGIAVFVAAVWIVTSGGEFDRTQTPAVPGPTETGPPPATASAAPDVVQREMCSDGARSHLELTTFRDIGGRHKVRFEVHRSPVGHNWRIELRHAVDGPPLSSHPPSVWRGTRVASDSGDLVVQRRVPDWNGLDKFVAKAVDTQTGQRCKVDAEIW